MQSLSMTSPRYLLYLVYPTALRNAKIAYKFGLSECNRVKLQGDNTNLLTFTVDRSGPMTVQSGCQPRIEPTTTWAVYYCKWMSTEWILLWTVEVDSYFSMYAYLLARSTGKTICIVPVKKSIESYLHPTQ